MPIYRPAGGPAAAGLETVELHGATWYVRRALHFSHDIPLSFARIVAGETPAIVPADRDVTLHYRDGFAMHIDNHEFVTRYVGLTAEQLAAEHDTHARRPGTR
jgi:hypothetical protein